MVGAEYDFGVFRVDGAWLARAISALVTVITCHHGVTLWQPAELDDADHLLCAALAVLRASLDPYDPVVAHALAGLAQIRQDRGDLAQGERLLTESLATLTAAYGTDHPEVAHGQDKLGYVVRLCGDHARSVDLHKTALLSLQATYGPDHVEVGWPLSNLALAHAAAGNLNQGLDLQLRARIFATDDPTGNAVHVVDWRIARLEVRLGALEPAIHRLAAALAAMRQVLRTDHADVIAMATDLADLESLAVTDAVHPAR